MQQTKLEKVIRESGYKQRHISKMTGISEYNLSRYKNDVNIPEVDLKLLANFFRCRKSDLVGIACENEYSEVS